MSRAAFNPLARCMPPPKPSPRRRRLSQPQARSLERSRDELLDENRELRRRVRELEQLLQPTLPTIPVG